MAYIGVSPSNGVRQKHTYTATASQTTFSGAGSEGISLSYRDSNYVDVYRNGVKLGDADYTATSGTSIVLGEGAAVNDIVEIVVYDVFSVADTVSKADGGTFDGNVAMAGTLAVTGETTLSTHLNMGDNDIIKLGAGDDLQIYHDGSHSIITDQGTGSLLLRGTAGVFIQNAEGTENIIAASSDGAVTLYHDNSLKLATTATGIDVTGTVVSDGMSTNTAGTSNFIAGVNAGSSLASGGINNVLVGDNAGDALTTGDRNVALGYAALSTDTTGNKTVAIGNGALTNQLINGDTFNTAVGYAAGNQITTGIVNTLIGYQAGDALTTGNNNVAVGHEALGAEIQGDASVAVGVGALQNQSNSSDVDVYNTAVGYSAGLNVTTGANNVAIGASALQSNTTASNNTAVGYQAGFSNTTGTENQAFGHTSLYSNTTGNYNNAFGRGALYNNTTGTNNTAVGTQALVLNTTASNNTAVGYQAFYSGQTADNTTALGYRALYSATAGGHVAVGSNALYTNSTGIDNVGVGASALRYNTTGSSNVALGPQALHVNTTASNNTAVGFQAGLSVTTGTGNTLIGQGAGQDITDGAYNTCLGFQTMTHDRNTNGNRNTVIGTFSDTSSTNSDDQIILGYNVIGTGNNAFTFGKAGTDSNIDFGATSITAPSDERYKEEITSSTAGLSFINDLRPVTFKWKKEKDIPSNHRSYVANSDERVMGRGDKVQHGFIAQEVKSVIDNHPEIQNGFEMWSEDESDGRQRLAPAELIPMLTKAVQELSAKNDALEARLSALENG